MIGTIIGLLAGFRFPESLMCGVKMGAFMLLIPRVVKCIMDGLIPIQERVRELAVRKFKGTSVFIGMDPAILLGDPTVMTAGILLVPITILLAVFMPGNRVLPLGDLATISFFIAIAAGIHHGNLFRTLLSARIGQVRGSRRFCLPEECWSPDRRQPVWIREDVQSPTFLPVFCQERAESGSS